MFILPSVTVISYFLAIHDVFWVFTFSFIRSRISPLAQLVALIDYTAEYFLLGIFMNLTRFLSGQCLNA